jgi:hypothetical protein
VVPASQPRSALKTPLLQQAGFSFLEGHMDREEGFPPHVIGFMKRKREKEKLDDAKPLKASPLDEHRRMHQTA